jgi:molecular chaperone Hsp33
MELKIHEEIKPMYKCDCCRDRVERALISIGKKDLEELYNDGKTEELKCQFCNKKYKFNHEDIGKLLKEVKS